MSAAVDRHAAMLARDGWCVFGRAVEPALLNAIEAELEPRFAATPFCQGAFYGEHTRRFGALLARAPAIEHLVTHPLILELVEQMLLPWCERIALNLTQAIEIHPGALAQLPHRDQDMWQGPKGGIEYLVNVMWPLTGFTRANGGTRLWTGSHFDQDIPILPEEDSIVPAVMPGDALVFLGSTLHGGGGNRSAAPRRGIVVSYCLGWLKPFELQWLVYPPQVARHFLAGSRGAGRLCAASAQPRQCRRAMPVDPARRCGARFPSRDRRAAAGPGHRGGPVCPDAARRSGVRRR
jgi:hypothetical protein